MICGGIDLGGTKIEARLFGGDAVETLAVRRVPTPKEAFAPMLETLLDQVRWLCDEAGDDALPVGIAVPGTLDPVSGEVFAANIPATGHSIEGAVTDALGRRLAVVNDAMAFAFSEAHGGAGEGARVVMGLILGTGVGGGLAVDGALPPRHAGLSVEGGHVGAPARALDRHGLPLWRCGCGRMGCTEAYVSGTGLCNIAEWATGTRRDAQNLVASDDAEARRILEVWADLAGEYLYTLQLLLDPDRIVIGGGLSNMPDIVRRLTDALAPLRLGAARLPDIRIARHGDSSGARGAALLATRQ